MMLDPSRATRLAFHLLLVACLAGAGWWLSPWRAHAATSAAAPAPVLEHAGGQVVVGEGSPLRSSLAVQGVAVQVVQVPFALPATVEADSARLVKILPPVAGRITRLDKRLGDAVRQGDPLFLIDSADLAQAQSDLQKASTALTLTRQALQRQRDLGSAEIAAQRDIEQAQSDFEQAGSEYARASARLSQLDAANPNAASGHTLAVRSPLAGRVIELNAASGGFWNDTTAPLMTVADLSTVFITANADEKDLGAIFVGQTARVVFDAYPGETFGGTVRYIGEVLDPDTRRVKVRLQFDNRDGRLKPGMFAKATLLSKAHAGLMLPLAAVVQSGFYTRVFIERAPWHFEPQVVSLGPRVGDAVEIIAGLKAGERVVVKDGVLLDD